MGDKAQHYSDQIFGSESLVHCKKHCIPFLVCDIKHIFSSKLVHLSLYFSTESVLRFKYGLPRTHSYTTGKNFSKSEKLRAPVPKENVQYIHCIYIR